MPKAKTVGTAVFASLAIPVGGLSALGAFGAALALLFSPGMRTGNVFLFFLVAAWLFGVAINFLAKQQKKGKQLVHEVNTRAALKLDPSNMLGYPSPVFLVFDRPNQMLAVCDSSTGRYEVYDASYVLRWYYTWATRESMEMAGGGNRVGNTQLHAPAFERVERRTNFRVVLEVANPARPAMEFPMSERAAIEWCARLNAIFNG
jgi:hypothetical protein